MAWDVKPVEDMLRTEMENQWVGVVCLGRLRALTAPFSLSTLMDLPRKVGMPRYAPTSTGRMVGKNVQMWDVKK